MIIRTHTSGMVIHRRQRHHNLGSSPPRSEVSDLQTGPPTLGDIHWKKEPHSFWFENQQDSCQKELKGCRKQASALKGTAHRLIHSKLRCRGSSLKYAKAIHKAITLANFIYF